MPDVPYFTFSHCHIGSAWSHKIQKAEQIESGAACRIRWSSLQVLTSAEADLWLIQCRQYIDAH
jgi:hypothetical protein